MPFRTDVEPNLNCTTRHSTVGFWLLIIATTCSGWHTHRVDAQEPVPPAPTPASLEASNSLRVCFHDGRVVACSQVKLHPSGDMLMLFSKRAGIEFRLSVPTGQISQVQLGEQTVAVSSPPSDTWPQSELTPATQLTGQLLSTTPLLEPTPAVIAHPVAPTVAWYCDPFDPCRLWPSTRSVEIGRLPAPLATYAHRLSEVFPAGVAPAESGFARELLRQRLWNEMLNSTAIWPESEGQHIDSTGSDSQFDSPFQVPTRSIPEGVPRGLPVTEPKRSQGSVSVSPTGRGQLAVAAETTNLPGRADLSAVRLLLDGTGLATRRSAARGTIHVELWGTRDSLLPTGDRNLYSRGGRTERLASWTRSVNFGESPLQHFLLPMQGFEQRWEFGPEATVQMQVVIPGRPVEHLTSEVRLRDLSPARVEQLMETGYLFADHQQTGQRRAVPARFRRTTSLRSHAVPGFVADGH